MNPTPKNLALLISLIGLGVPWTAVAFGEETTGLPSSALGVDAREALVRNVLGLQETANKNQATSTVSRLSKTATKTKSTVDITSAKRVKNVKWDRTALGLGANENSVEASPSAGRQTEQRERAQTEQLAKIRFILGLETRIDVASVHLPQRVNRAGDALLHPAVAVGAAPRQPSKPEVASASSASIAEISMELPQLLAPIPEATGDTIAEAIFGQSPVPKTPERDRDEPPPMLADGSVGSRREERRLPLLMLVPTTPSDEVAPAPEQPSADAGANRNHQTNAIALATPSELTADYLDPLMPLLRAIRALDTQQSAAFTERDSSTASTSAASAAGEAANDELAELRVPDSAKQAPHSVTTSQTIAILASGKVEAIPIALLAKIELPKTPVLMSGGEFVWAMLPVVALAKPSEAIDVQIAASKSTSDGALNSPSEDEAGKPFLTAETLSAALASKLKEYRSAIPQSSGAANQEVDEQTVRPDGALATPKNQNATETAPNEASVAILQKGISATSAPADISSLPLVNQGTPIGAGLNPVSTDSREGFTLREALSAWFDIFDPRMVAPKVVAGSRLAARSALSSRSAMPAMSDSNLLPAPDRKTSFIAPPGLMQEQILPNLDIDVARPVAARLNIASIESPDTLQKSNKRADPLMPAATSGKSRKQTAAKVPEESTIEKVMARHALAASTRAVSQEATNKPQVSMATAAPSSARAYAQIESSVQDKVHPDLPRETQRPPSNDLELASAIQAPDEPRANPLQGELVALSDSKLDQMRGGFETDSGLKISFGIERAVYINGSLVTTTSLNVSDLSKLSAGQAQAAGLGNASLGLIQNGPSNTFAPGQIAASSVATVIQNTLNDQRIQGITLINATVNSLDLIKHANVQSSIQNALTDSLRR